MFSLAEIEAAVDSLPPGQQEELLRHLADRLKPKNNPMRTIPMVPATGREITQQEIDDACDAD
jgi:hypothetical protein